MTFSLIFLGLIGLIVIDVPIAIALGVVSVVAVGLTSGFRPFPTRH